MRDRGVNSTQAKCRVGICNFGLEGAVGQGGRLSKMANLSPWAEVRRPIEDAEGRR